MSRFDPLAGVFTSRTDADKRTAGRLAQEEVSCNLGPVLDLSGTGMKVQTRRIPRGRIKVILKAGGTAIRLYCEPRWVKKIGFLKYQVGLEFVDFNDEFLTLINQIAMEHRVRRTM